MPPHEVITPVYFLKQDVDRITHARNYKLEDIEYVGITNLSVHVATKDGTLYRITNPHFTQGLEVSEEARLHD